MTDEPKSFAAFIDQLFAELEYEREDRVAHEKAVLSLVDKSHAEFVKVYASLLEHWGKTATRELMRIAETDPNSERINTLVRFVYKCSVMEMAVNDVLGGEDAERAMSLDEKSIVSNKKALFLLLRMIPRGKESKH